MGRAEKNRGLYNKLNSELEAISEKKNSLSNASKLFDSLRSIDQKYFADIIKEFDNNEIMNPYVETKQDANLLDENIKIDLRRVLKEFQLPENSFNNLNNIETDTPKEHVFASPELRKLRDEVIKSIDLRNNLKQETLMKIDRSRKAAFDGVNLADLDKWKNTKKDSRMISELGEVNKKLDDINDTIIKSYSSFNKKSYVKKYKWIYLFCSVVMILCIISIFVITK